MTRLFLIDDHAMLREGMRALLQAAGHQIVGEADEPTRGMAEMIRVAPDVVVLDLNLGERSGFEVLADMQRRGLSTKAIVLTSSDQPRDVAEAVRLGALGYVLKSAASHDLLRAIDAAGRGQSYFSEGCAELAIRGLTEANAGGTEVLSPRERQVLVMVARGLSSSAIGELMHLSPKTIDTYRSRLMSKLNLGDVPALVRWCIRQGLVDTEER